jgi:small conductance mechanosensitive channel
VTPALFLLDVTSGNDWSGWFERHNEQIVSHATRIAIILVLLFVMSRVFRIVVARALQPAISRAATARAEDAAARSRRAGTLSATLNWAFGIFLVFLGAGLLLAEIEVDVSALIAGVGVVGIALGLGAQTLVKDVINGMFILIEDQYAVGDQITIAGLSGQVVEINPRRTVLRDRDGSLHSIPNSTVTTATNRTPGLGRVRVEIVVAFRDADPAARLAAEVARELTPGMPGVTSAPQLVDQSMTAEGDVRLLLVGDAAPGMRWDVESDLRRRLERRFHAEHVEMRFGSPP